MSVETVSGSCHCRAVTYSAQIDFGEPTIRCNCSICTKSRTWIAPIPASKFKLMSGADAISEYRFGRHAITHCFCSRCGIKTHGRIKDEHGQESLIAVCVATLELGPERFAEMDVAYCDGRNDDFAKSPEHTSYL